METAKINVYYLYDGGKLLHRSCHFEKLLNYTTKTKDAEIYYNGVLVWTQKF